MHRSTSHLALAVAATAAAAVIAACGSSSRTASSPSGSSGQPTVAEMQQDGVRFSDCMRSHAVPGFPDPTDPRAFKSALSPNSAEARSPAFGSAYEACARFLPRGGAPNHNASHTPAQIAGVLAFARCLRGHGFPSFPDPTSAGELTHEMVAAAGINLQQPGVLRAGDACAGVTHGVITKAIVARFVAGQ